MCAACMCGRLRLCMCMHVTCVSVCAVCVSVVCVLCCAAISHGRGRDRCRAAAERRGLPLLPPAAGPEAVQHDRPHDTRCPSLPVACWLPCCVGVSSHHSLSLSLRHCADARLDLGNSPEELQAQPIPLSNITAKHLGKVGRVVAGLHGSSDVHTDRRVLHSAPG